MDDKVSNERRREIFTKKVKAGKRTYFFDVRQTRKGDLFLTITESTKVFNKKKKDKFHFKKHKIFLYKEDFENFHEAFKEVVGFVDENVEESLEKGGLDPEDFQEDKPDSDQNQDKKDEQQDENTSENQADSQPESDSEDNSDKDQHDEFTDVSFDDLDEADKDKND